MEKDTETMKKKKKRTSFRALTFAQIMTQRMQKSESGVVVKKEGKSRAFDVEKNEKNKKEKERRRSEDFSHKLAKFKLASETGKMIDMNVTYNDEEIFQKLSHKDRVESFFKLYNPSKLEDPKFLATLMRTYEDRADILIKELTRIYGPEPSKNSHIIVPPQLDNDQSNNLPLEKRVRNLLAIESFRERVEEIYQKYNPSKLEDSKFIETLLNVYSGNENLLLQQLVAKYGYEDEDDDDDDDNVIMA